LAKTISLNHTDALFSTRAFIFSASDYICYNELINHKTETTDNLITVLLKKGGRINKFYLQKKKRNPSLVYLNGWFSGRNIREAILKALEGR